MPRVFVAVRMTPTPEVDDLARRLAALGRSVRVVARENLHMTVRFLGQIADDQLSPISQAVESITKDVRAFDLRLMGVDVLPTHRHPRVVCVGAHADEVLSAMVERLSTSLEAMGFPKELRPWTPHVTVARIKSRPPAELFTLVEAYRASEFGVVPIRSVDQMVSEQHPSGVQYGVAHQARLEQGG